MEIAELQNIWQQILDKVSDVLAPKMFQQWLVPLKPISLENGVLMLQAENNFSQQYIESRYIPFLKDAARDVLGAECTISFQPNTAQSTEPEELITELPEQQENLYQSVPGNPPASDPLSPIPAGDSSTLNPKNTFTTFVSGESNRLAHAASLSVADNPGSSYNPLFMYGKVGLGKTHLMHAIGHKILEKDPTKRVLYISSEKFTNELINSIRDGNPEAFRNKYRTVDVLMVDDIQFLYKKERTQEEFFHTFNTLYDAKKQIIIASDRHPREIRDLEERLRSRFEWGLTADIKPPDFETRVAILKKKAMLENIEAPNDGLRYIAGRIQNNIRELEGALTRVAAFASLYNEPITMDLIQKAMKEISPEQPTKDVTFELIQEVVASHFKITVEDLISKKRTSDLAMARQVAMYLCREMIEGASLPQIGSFFGGRDHTTVIHAVEKISAKCSSDQKFNASVEDLKQRIQRM